MQLQENARKHVKTFQYHMSTHLRGIGGGAGVYTLRPNSTSETDPPGRFLVSSAISKMLYGTWLLATDPPAIISTES